MGGKNLLLLALFAVLLLVGCTSLLGSKTTPTPAPTPAPTPQATPTPLLAPTPIPIPSVTEAPRILINSTNSKYLELDDFRAIDESLSRLYHVDSSVNYAVANASWGRKSLFAFNHSRADLLPLGSAPSNLAIVTLLYFDNSSKASEYFYEYSLNLSLKGSVTYLRNPASIPSVYTLVNNNVSLESEFAMPVVGSQSAAYRRIIGRDELAHYALFYEGNYFVAVEMHSPQGYEQRNVEFAFKLAKITQSKFNGVQLAEKDKAINCPMLLRLSDRTDCAA